MSNTNTVIDMVAKEALRLAHEKATFLGTVTREYDDSFAKTGAKIGSTLRVRNPNAYTRTTGTRVMNVQDTTETTQTITVATQDHVDLRWNSAELALDIDELSRRYIDPAMSVLVSGIDGDCLATATKGTYNLVSLASTNAMAANNEVGYTASGYSDISSLGKARAMLNMGLAPKDKRRAVQIDSMAMSRVANGMKGLFLPTTQVERAFLDGFIAHTAMADFYENDRTWSQTVGADVTVATSSSSAATDGGTTITMNGSDGSVNAGDIFTLPKVYRVHPETKVNTGQLMQFVCTAASTGAITVSPATYWTGPKQNVCNATGGTSVVADFDSETMTFFGTAATAYRQALMYHEEAFTFVTADLPLMGGADKCVRMTKDGISLRVWQDGDIRNDELLMRIDILYGFKVLRPEWACRIQS